MAGSGVKVYGVKRLRRSMKKAGQDLADLKAVHAEVAAYVANLAAGKAPRRTGKLAGSVRGNKAVARSTVMAGRASVPYAAPIHWGWPARNIERNAWIGRAALDSEAQWLAMFVAGMDSAIRKIEGA